MKTPATGKRRNASIAAGNPYTSGVSVIKTNTAVKTKQGERNSKKEQRDSVFNVNREIAVETYMNGVRQANRDAIEEAMADQSTSFYN